jgi:hypothetical protein
MNRTAIPRGHPPHLFQCFELVLDRFGHTEIQAQTPAEEPRG